MNDLYMNSMSEKHFRNVLDPVNLHLLSPPFASVTRLIVREEQEKKEMQGTTDISEYRTTRTPLVVLS